MDPTLPAMPVELTWQSVIIFVLGIAAQWAAGKFAAKPSTPASPAPVPNPAPAPLEPTAEPRLGDGHLLRQMLPVLLQLAGLAARLAPLIAEKPPEDKDKPKPPNT